MAGNTLELPDLSLESVEYQTPQELAEALEERSKQALANKIRAIAGQVQENSSDQLGRLREELSPEEQTEIRDALPWSGIGRFLSKWMKKAEVAQDTMVASLGKVIPWGEETVGQLSKLETWWHSIEDSWNTAEKLFSEGKFMAALWVIMSGFMGKFSLTDWDKSQKEEPEIKTGLNTPEIIASKEVGRFTMKILVDYAYVWAGKWDVLNVCQKTNFKNLSLEELQKIAEEDTKLDAWIVETYGQNSWISRESVKKAFSLFSQEGKWYLTLQRILKDKLKPTTTLQQAISLTNNDFYIFEHISSLTPDSIMTEASELVRFDAWDFQWTWEAPKAFLDRGISKELWIFIFTSKYQVGDNLDDLLKNSWLQDSEKTKLREMIDFWAKLQQEIISNPKINLGMSEDMKRAFAEKPLTLAEITKMYLILWGESKFESMNELQQGFMYFSLSSLLDSNRSFFDNGKYMIKFVDLLSDTMVGKVSEIQVPPWVIEFMSSVGNALFKYIEQSLEKMGITIAWGFLEAVKKYPFLVPVILWIILCYPMVQRKSLLGKLLPKFWK